MARSYQDLFIIVLVVIVLGWLFNMQMNVSHLESEPKSKEDSFANRKMVLEMQELEHKLQKKIDDLEQFVKKEQQYFNFKIDQLEKKSVARPEVAAIPTFSKYLVRYQDLNKTQKFERTEGRWGNWCSAFKCDWNIENCHPKEPTNYRGVNPPCCTHLLRDMLVQFVTFLENHDIEYMLTYGTLLGAYRDEMIIPWTADTDLALPVSSFNVDIQKLGEKLSQQGLEVFESGHFGCKRVCYNKHYMNGLLEQKWPDRIKSSYQEKVPYMDLYRLLKEKPGGGPAIILQTGPMCLYNASMMYPIKKMPFYGVLMSVPNNVPQFLRKVYGDNFMKPTGSKEHHGIHGNCKGDHDAIQALHISRKWQPYED